MTIRFLAFFFCLFCGVSCSYFSSDAKKQTQLLDTIVDFTKVDVSPSFTICDSLIDDEKTACFRKEIHNRFAEELLKHPIKITDSINEVVTVFLLIDAKGKVSLKNIQSSEVIQKEIPMLDSLLIVSVNNLPVLQPAIKRGIPVATQYQLPIKIQLKE